MESIQLSDKNKIYVARKNLILTDLEDYSVST